MQHGKKRLATAFFPVLIGLVSMLVAACGGGAANGPSASQTDKASADKQIYISPINVQNFKTLDPATVTDQASGYAIQQLFTGLVELDSKGNIIPVIAKSYTHSEDGKTWTFT